MSHTATSRRVHCMKEPEMRLLILGSGGMANQHAKNFGAIEGVSVVGCVDILPERLAAFAKEHKIERSFTSLEAALAWGQFDAVANVTPDGVHHPTTMQAIAAGKHVFCEKPPALNAREMMVMKATAEKAKRTLMFNFNNRARPESYAMMEYIQSGVVGRINTCQAKWIRRTGIPGFGGWFTTKALSGGGPLIDLLHMIDLGLYFMGYPDPAHVMAQTFTDHITDKTFKGPWGIPDVAKGATDVESAAHGFVSFKSGQCISFAVSWAEMNKREEVSVVFQGAKAGGMVKRLFAIDGLDDTATDTCELYTHEQGRAVNRSITVPPDAPMGRVRSAINFIRALEGTEKPLNTPDQALKLMKIIDGAYKSAATGKPVAL